MQPDHVAHRFSPVPTDDRSKTLGESLAVASLRPVLTKRSGRHPKQHDGADWRSLCGQAAGLATNHASRWDLTSRLSSITSFSRSMTPFAHIAVRPMSFTTAAQRGFFPVKDSSK